MRNDHMGNEVIEERIARLEAVVETLAKIEIAKTRRYNAKNAIPGYDLLEAWPEALVPYVDGP